VVVEGAVVGAVSVEVLVAAGLVVGAVVAEAPVVAPAGAFDGGAADVVDGAGDAAALGAVVVVFDVGEVADCVFSFAARSGDSASSNAESSLGSDCARAVTPCRSKITKDMKIRITCRTKIEGDKKAAFLMFDLSASG
jgi:hypothetical protein